MLDWVDQDVLLQFDILLWSVGAGIVFVIAMHLFPILRRWWHIRALRKRLAQDPYILESDLREYEMAIADASGTVDEEEVPSLGERIAGVAFGLAYPMLLIWLGAVGGQGYALALTFAALLLGALFWLWKRANAPPERDFDTGSSYEGPPEVEFPTDALHGFAAAIAVLALIGGLVWMIG